MVPSFPCFHAPPELLGRLLAASAETAEVWGPVVADDGVCRLSRLAPGVVPADAGELGFLPLKKLLLPAREAVWHWNGHECRPAGAGARRLVVGVPLCELQGLWYLDQVFAADELYRARRATLTVIGTLCQPDGECRCRLDRLPVAGDLFCAPGQVWTLSAAGETLLREFCSELVACGVRPLPPVAPEPGLVVPTPVTCTDFPSTAGAPVWAREGAKCLACGACSAVCPTCYCFDMVDAGAPGAVTRYRVWDNCFFPDHGRVAGGGDFRPGRAARLRFRFEHKRLGFGSLRGLESCVGCGRCRRACPVDIDLDRIAEELSVLEGA